MGFYSSWLFSRVLAFAIVLLVAPWFVIQPALGFGFMAARTPSPGTVRAINVRARGLWSGPLSRRHHLARRRGIGDRQSRRRPA
jgi:hypothetical protein